MTESTHHSAPTPVGDVVPGDPPVPITVWPVPGPQPGESMSNALGVRLVHNLTHPGDLIVDLTEGPQLARAVIAARRRSNLQNARPTSWGRERAALIVAGWPIGAEGPIADFLALCRDHLRPSGCVAALLPHGDVVLPVDVVVAAKQARLAYLQHIVAVGQPQRSGPHTRLDIHTDVLILTRSTADGEADDA